MSWTSQNPKDVPMLSIGAYEDHEKEIDLEIKNLNSEIDNIFKEKEKEILKI